jgi:hypothetical protein
MRAPELLLEELQHSLYQGLVDENIQLEGVHPSIETDNPAYFIPQYQLNEKVLAVLHPIVEAWSGVKLTGNNAYGLRVSIYLCMQADWRNDNHTKSQTTLRLHRCIATALD